jgi:hypothetical protein
MSKERIERNKRIYQAKQKGMSINEIALNPSLNPERVSQQRVHQILKEYEKKYLQTPKGELASGTSEFKAG